MRTLLLIDANSIIHRSFHALPPLTDKGGKPIQAIYGLSSILLKLWREERPDYAAALFDRPEPTFREEKYAEYKAQRPPAPDGLIPQIIEAHNLFGAFGIKTFEIPGFEADDLIATVAEKFRDSADLRIIILTGDRDTLQLVEGDKVVVKAFKKGVSETIVYDEKNILENYGLAPGRLIDYKALVGDPSDNIKGVPGIGPKTALSLLRKYGDLDNVYKNVSFEGKLGEKLQSFKKEAELSKELVILIRNAPLEIGDIDEIKIADPTKEITEYFSQMGFSALIKRLNAGTRIKEKKEEKKKSQQAMF